MNAQTLLDREFINEFKFSTSRSGGPGGQNVNKVSSKVELRFNIPKSALLSDEEKELIMIKLANRINNEGELVLFSQSERSQLANKELVIDKFYSILTKALKVQKKRKPTKPTARAKAKRMDNKRLKSEKKVLRKNIDYQ